MNEFEMIVNTLVNVKDEKLVQFIVTDKQDEENSHEESIEGLRDRVNDIFWSDDEEDEEIDGYEMTVAALIECLDTCDYDVRVISKIK